MRAPLFAAGLWLALLLPAARGEEVHGTLLERGGGLRLGGRELVAAEERLATRLRAWIGRDVAVEGELQAGKLRVTRVISPREVRLEGWVARDHEGVAPLLWCAETEVWRCFGPALDALRAARGRRVTAAAWAFTQDGAPDALCVESVEPGPERAEPVDARGTLSWDEGQRAFLLRPAEGPPWRLTSERVRSPAPWLGRLCGRALTLSGLALPAAPGASARTLLVERAPRVETLIVSGTLEEGALVSQEHGRLPLPPPCTVHGGGDPAALLARLRGKRVQLKGQLLRDAEGRAVELLVAGAVAQDDAGRIVLIHTLGADEQAHGALAGEPASWPLQRLRFEPAAPPPRRIPGH